MSTRNVQYRYLVDPICHADTLSEDQFNKNDIKWSLRQKWWVICQGCRYRWNPTFWLWLLQSSKKCTRKPGKQGRVRNTDTSRLTARTCINSLSWLSNKLKGNFCLYKLLLVFWPKLAISEFWLAAIHMEKWCLQLHVRVFGRSKGFPPQRYTHNACNGTSLVYSGPLSASQESWWT